MCRTCSRGHRSARPERLSSGARWTPEQVRGDEQVLVAALFANPPDTPLPPSARKAGKSTGASVPRYVRGSATWVSEAGSAEASAVRRWLARLCRCDRTFVALARHRGCPLSYVPVSPSLVGCGSGFTRTIPRRSMAEGSTPPTDPSAYPDRPRRVEQMAAAYNLSGCNCQEQKGIKWRARRTAPNRAR